jgi:Spy/CpxP family protein refolding chaperone
MSGPRTGDRQKDESEFAPAPDRGGPSDERREEVRKKIEAIRIWRLTEELKLDPPASARLSSFLSSMEQKRREITKNQMEIMRDLRHSLRSAKPDEAKMRTNLEKLEKNHNEMQALRSNEFKGLKELLTVEQQARYLLFQQDFQREMREMISGARGRGKGNGGAGPGGTVPEGPEEDHPQPYRKGQ